MRRTALFRQAVALTADFAAGAQEVRVLFRIRTYGDN
jgi:hypothetical protein